MIRIEHNVETGEVKEIQMTQEEINAWQEKDQAEAQQFQIQIQQKQALLERLGITEEEAKLLLS
jgi:mevalonate kinase